MLTTYLSRLSDLNRFLLISSRDWFLTCQECVEDIWPRGILKPKSIIRQSLSFRNLFPVELRSVEKIGSRCPAAGLNAMLDLLDITMS
jgi:hypothetical protein